MCVACRRLAPGARVETVRLDLGDLASVRDCASALMDRDQRIDVLLNNAGRWSGGCVFPVACFL